MKKIVTLLLLLLITYPGDGFSSDIILPVDTNIIVSVNIFPLLDDVDFKSIETAVVYNSAGLALTWNFVTTAGVVSGTAVTPTTTGVYDWSEPVTDKGMYAIEIPASGGGTINNDTEGYGWFTGVATGVLPWRSPVIQFSSANVVNSLVDGTTKLSVDVGKWNGTAVGTTQQAGFPTVTIKDGTSTGEIDTSSGGIAHVVLSDTVTTYTGNTPQTGDSFTRIGAAGAGLTDLGGMSTTMKAQVNTEADTALTDYGALKPTVAGRTLDVAVGGEAGMDLSNTLGTLDAVLNDNAITEAKIAPGAINVSEAPNLDAAMSSRASQASVNTIDDFVDTEVGAIKTTTDKFVFTIANQVDANALTGGGLTAQQTRDAMKLAPSSGAPAALSIDENTKGIAITIDSANTDTWNTIQFDEAGIITVDNQFRGNVLQCGKEYRIITLTDYQSAADETITIEPGNPFNTAPAGGSTCYIR